MLEKKEPLDAVSEPVIAMTTTEVGIVVLWTTAVVTVAVVVGKALGRLQTNKTIKLLTKK